MHRYEKDIEREYRVVDGQPTLGGIVSLADYCPYLQVSVCVVYLGVFFGLVFYGELKKS